MRRQTCTVCGLRREHVPMQDFAVSTAGHDERASFARDGALPTGRQDRAYVQADEKAVHTGLWARTFL
jgi:hypothetical protein